MFKGCYHRYGFISYELTMSLLQKSLSSQTLFPFTVILWLNGWKTRLQYGLLFRIDPDISGCSIGFLCYRNFLIYTLRTCF
jgi:hypothetical protein